MEVVCVIGERLYHAPGSACHKNLDAAATILTLTEAQAHEVGMEPCGFCLGGMSQENPKPKSG